MNKKIVNKNIKKEIQGISIIIPCFNVEKYIVNCLESLLEQLKNYNYEIILIDDCSKDSTKKVIKMYLNDSKNPNITLLENKENIGAGASRNKAIKISKYDVISFIDADDYVDDNFFEEMINKMQENDADIVACDFNIIYEETGKSEISKACEFVPSKFNLLNNGLAASPCNKLIKKEYLEKYPFAEGIMNEDVPCILSVIANCTKVNYTDKTKYNYIQHKGSVQNSILSSKRLDIITAYNMFINRIKDNAEYNEFSQVVMYHQIICFLLYVPSKEENMFKRAKFLKSFYHKLGNIDIRKNHYYWDFIDGLSGKTKLYYKLMIRLICSGFIFMASFEIQFYKLYAKLNKRNVIKQDLNMDDLIKASKNQNAMPDTDIKISVVVPNYNYEKFLEQRIYSILNQNYKIYELIILDDCSKDNSIAKIEEIKAAISKYVNVKTFYNETNSGSAFKQWKKGMEIATGNYIWIAEADDYCEKNLIRNLIKPIKKDKNIMLSYADTAFIDAEGKIILKTIKPEIDIQKSGHWNHSYINEGIDEIKKFSFLNCTIANVSSCLIKNGKYEEYLKMSGEFRQAGDWLFYVNLISNGDIAFSNKVLNYYRVHGNNVSSTTNYQRHIDEIKRIHKYFVETFNLTTKEKNMMKERIDFLEKVWKLK